MYQQPGFQRQEFSFPQQSQSQPSFNQMSQPSFNQMRQPSFNQTNQPAGPIQGFSNLPRQNKGKNSNYSGPNSFQNAQGQFQNGYQGFSKNINQGGGAQMNANSSGPISGFGVQNTRNQGGFMGANQSFQTNGNFGTNQGFQQPPRKNKNESNFQKSTNFNSRNQTFPIPNQSSSSGQFHQPNQFSNPNTQFNASNQFGNSTGFFQQNPSSGFSSTAEKHFGGNSQSISNGQQAIQGFAKPTGFSSIAEKHFGGNSQSISNGQQAIQGFAKLTGFSSTAEKSFGGNSQSISNGQQAIQGFAKPETNGFFSNKNTGVLKNPANNSRNYRDANRSIGFSVPNSSNGGFMQSNPVLENSKPKEMSTIVSHDKNYLYSEETELSTEDMEAYRGEKFTFTSMPLNPPPKSLS